MLTTISATLPGDLLPPPPGDHPAGTDVEGFTGAEGLFTLVMTSQALSVPAAGGAEVFEAAATPRPMSATIGLVGLADRGAYPAVAAEAAGVGPDPAAPNTVESVETAPDLLKAVAESEPGVMRSGPVALPAIPEVHSVSADAPAALSTSEAVDAAPVSERQKTVMPAVADRTPGSANPADPVPDAPALAPVAADGNAGDAGAKDVRRRPTEGAAEGPQATSESSSRRPAADSGSGEAAVPAPRPEGAVPTESERQPGTTTEVTTDPARPIHVAPEVRRPDFPLPTGAAPRSEDAAATPARQLAEVAQRLPGGPVEISLSPEELGKVRMSLLGGEGQMTVQIVAERPETLDLLRRHIDMLASELRQQGFTDLSFSFGQGGLSGEGASSSANAGGDHGEPPVTDTLPETLPEWGRRPAAGSLDLRI